MYREKMRENNTSHWDLQTEDEREKHSSLGFIYRR